MHGFFYIYIISCFFLVLLLVFLFYSVETKYGFENQIITAYSGINY